MDNTDKQLLNLLQSEFPIDSEPFRIISDRLHISESETILRTGNLKENGVIRQISAIFDSASLGYKSALVAFSVPNERVEQVAEIVSAHPGVSHNYERNHAYNLWFTIAVPPGTDLETEIGWLVDKCSPRVSRIFPTLRMFKIGVVFDMAEGTITKQKSKTSGKNVIDLDERDIDAVRVLQQDLPIEPHPFETLGLRACMQEDELLAKARFFLEVGAMRRYAAVLRHREAGFKANAMAAWKVDENDIERIGAIMAAHPNVSHCYQRPTYPDWPYSIFAMIHGRTSEDCEKAATELSNATGITDYVLLYSTREFKKTRVQYYEQSEQNQLE